MQVAASPGWAGTGSRVGPALPGSVTAKNFLGLPPGRPSHPQRTGCEPTLPQNASGLWRAFFWPGLGSNTQCFASLSHFQEPGCWLLQGARSSAGCPRIPDPSLVLTPSQATCPLRLCCPSSINPALKGLLEECQGPREGEQICLCLLELELGGVPLLTVNPPALHPQDPRTEALTPPLL